MESKNSKEFIGKNFSMILWILGAIFAAGGLYAEFKYLQGEIEILDSRLDKKIQILNELETRVDENEGFIDYHRGYLDGKNEE